MPISNKTAHIEQKLEKLQKYIRYGFADLSYLYMAVTHKTAKTAKKKSKNYNQDYERLEFLGDRILAMFVAEKLYLSFPDEEPGKMTPKMHQLVSGKYCAHIARKINLGECLIIGKQAEKDNIRKNETVLADACEALIAAIYLDAEKQNKNGKKYIWDVLNQFWGKNIITDQFGKDHKTTLQEWAQKYYKSLPQYIINKTGPDNKPIFHARAIVNQNEMGKGKGETIKLAEQKAASNALKKIKNNAL